MKTIWLITKRELTSFFDSLTAYIMIVLFLGFSGFFTWISGSDIFLIGQASLRTFFSIAYWTLFFFIPALTMRLIAEEKTTCGTSPDSHRPGIYPALRNHSLKTGQSRCRRNSMRLSGTLSYECSLYKHRAFQQQHNK
jgi:hypothetical protein